VLGLDTETTLATEAEPIARLVSVALCGASGPVLFAAHDPALPGVLERVLTGTIASANVPFDWYVLARAFPELIPTLMGSIRDGRFWDVLTNEKHIDIASGEYRHPGGYGLKGVAKRRTGLDLEKGEDTWRMRYSELLGLEITDWPEDAREYALLDARAHYETAIAQAPYLTTYLRPAADNVRAHIVLYGQYLRGVATDQDAVDRLDQRLTKEFHEHTLRCLLNGLVRFKHKKKRPSPLVRSTKAATEMLLKIPNVRVTYTDTGRVALSEDALKTAGIPAGHPLDSYRRRGSVQTLRTGWVEPLRSPVIRTRYDELVDTGRTSSGPPGDPFKGRNLQNTPQKGGYRECLRARPGHRLVVIDFGGLELVTLAQKQFDWLGSSRLGDALRDGRDPHSEMGARLLGIDSDLFDKRKPAHALKRKLAKALNFGLPGALGAARFVDYAAREPYEIVLTEAEARQLKATWLDQWPDMKEYFRYINRHETSMGVFELTEERSGHVRGGMFYPEACNFPFQCLGAYVAKRALWREFEAGIPTVLFVHDELVAEPREEDAEHVLEQLSSIMIAAARELCPDVPIKVEGAVMERYGKP